MLSNAQMDKAEFVLEAVVARTEVTSRDLMSKTRRAQPALARSYAAWLMKQQFGFTLEQVGEVLNRSHTTIHHAVARIQKLILCDPEVIEWHRDVGPLVDGYVLQDRVGAPSTLPALFVKFRAAVIEDGVRIGPAPSWNIPAPKGRIAC